MVQSAAAVLLAHNHPSGDPEPSEEDLSITYRLVECGELPDIGMPDRIVVADRGLACFRARQLLRPRGGGP